MIEDQLCCSARGLRADRRDKLLKLLDTGGQNCTPNNTPPHSEAYANPPSQPKQARLGRVAPAQQIPSLHSDRLSAQPPIRLPPRLPAFPATPTTYGVRLPPPRIHQYPHVRGNLSQSPRTVLSPNSIIDSSLYGTDMYKPVTGDANALNCLAKRLRALPPLHFVRRAAGNGRPQENASDNAAAARAGPSFGPGPNRTTSNNSERQKTGNDRADMKKPGHWAVSGLSLN